MSTPEIAQLLRAIADVIEKNSPEQIAAVVEALAAGGSGRASKISGKPKAPPEARPDMQAVSRRLLEFTDRDEARRFLAETELTRKELMGLARTNNVHVVKEDKIEIVESRIVEALVGSRLNSRAIRGDVAHGSGPTS